MRFNFIKRLGTWRDVADAARTTIGMDAGEGEPSSQWKRRMFLAEHSPIRILRYIGMWEGLKSWVSVHFVRHKFGIEHWVSTQRTDRTGVNRDELPQSSLVNHKIDANAQAIINMSRKRLCNQASLETRVAWIEFLNKIELENPELWECCVPDCVYRGHCFEYKSCGFHKTEKFKRMRRDYIKGINQ